MTPAEMLLVVIVAVVGGAVGVVLGTLLLVSFLYLLDVLGL